MSHDVYVSVLFILNCIGLFYVFFVSPMIACFFFVVVVFSQLKDDNEMSFIGLYSITYALIIEVQ